MENQARAYLRLFKDLCKQINSSLDFGEVLRSLTENTVKTLDVKGSAIYLLDSKNMRLRLSASHGLSRAYLQKGPIDAEKSIVESLNGKWVRVADATQDERIQYPKEARQEGVVSILSVPLALRDQVIGVLRIYTGAPREFSEMEKELISGLAEIGSIGIENARMYHHLKADYDRLISDVYQWFDFGKQA